MERVSSTRALSYAAVAFWVALGVMVVVYRSLF